MYEDSDLFDPNSMIVQDTDPSSEDCFSQIGSESVMTATAITQTQNSFSENVGTLSMEVLPYPYSCGEQEDAIIATTTTTTKSNLTNNGIVDAMEIIGHTQQMGLDMEIPYNNCNAFNTPLVEEDNNNSSNNHSSSHDLSFDHFQFPYPTQTPDLLKLLHMSRSPNSSLANSSISFENPITTHNNTNITTSLPKPSSGWVGNTGLESTNVSTVSNDPLLHLNLQAPPPHAALRELFHQSLPNGYTMTPPSRSDFDFGFGDDDIEGNGVVAYHDGDGRDLDNGVLEFTQDVAYVGKKRGGKRTKQFTSTTERQRRVDLSSKFDALRELIPSPSKNDRASVVGDAINYIRELLRTVNELKLLLEKKRYEKQRVKRHKVEEGGDLLLEGCNLKQQVPHEHSYVEGLRSSWIQRKSEDTEVDVRIIDNEVTIKLVQRKRVNCLVYASQVLDELKLDLQHVAGGHIGDFYSFMFNSKICEGSSVYASAIANKLIEVMDKSLAAI